MSGVTIYDKKEIYNEKIEPILKELKLQCDANRIPMFFTAAVKNDETATEYKSSIILASTSVHLSDNRIGKCVLHLNKIRNDPETTLPGSVENAVRIIDDYLQSVSGEDEESVDVELYEDVIGGMEKIVNGGDGVSIFPRRDTDEFSDI